jgi:hypothetical protein
MQNKSFTLDGSGLGTIKAPCPCEAVDIIDVSAFTFQYAARADEVAQPEQASKAIGDAVAAAQYTATYFEFKAESPRFKPWNTGDTIGFVVGTAAHTVGVRPRRPGGS